ncbi:hypothetical protein tb265_47020 [Gemmatimonadetes bacterium T265]|nr:hypothetical protein tb265_47020 [Gemmatimonadetes bacterium T265]
MAGAALVPTPAVVADQDDAACFAYPSEHERRVPRRLLEDRVTRLGITALPVD